MKRTLIAAVSALALAACGQQATETTESQTPSAEQQTTQTAGVSNAEFVQTVANSDAFEIQSSELAAQRAARQDVKEFASMMVRDHTATS